jgi:uncharacterized protein YggE
MKTKYFCVFVLALSIIFMSGCNKKAEPQGMSTVSVLGTGTVLVQPDVIQMTITLSKVAQTTKTAQEEVGKMVRQALKILKDADIEDKNISTASLTFRSEYEYTSRRTLVGQRAEQIITFSVEGIGNNDEKVSGIIDQLIQINGIELNQINFSVKDTTDYFVRSRELAFQKALDKANQYAELSKLKVIKVLSISEEGAQQISPMNNKAYNQLTNFASADMAFGRADSTVLPTGELEITTRIVVLFLLE